MKRITLFRHGKSSWAHGGLADVDRPLLQKGEKRTKQMAEALRDMGLFPDLIVTSHAVRALRTATLVAETLNLPSRLVMVDTALYHASPQQIWDVIFALPDTASHVVLFGHNPGFTEFARTTLHSDTDWLPTSGVATALFHCEHWHQCPNTPPSTPQTFVPDKHML